MYQQREVKGEKDDIYPAPEEIASSIFLQVFFNILIFAIKIIKFESLNTQSTNAKLKLAFTNSYHLLTNKTINERREFGINVLCLFIKTQFHNWLVIFNIKNKNFYYKYWSF